MKVTVLGSGAPPVPQTERAGTSIAISVGDETILLDCGHRTVQRLMENRIDMTEITEVLFTHHHLDHNSGFFRFAILGWALGRSHLNIYGPRGTTDLVKGMETSYQEHIRSWREYGHPPDEGRGISDIETYEVDAEFTREFSTCDVTALPVRHNVETVAYRIDDRQNSDSIVFSGDTGSGTGLSEFASGADVLIHECNWISPGTLLEMDDVAEEYLAPPFKQGYFDVLSDRLGSEPDEETAAIHSTPAQAGETASAAGVDTLVLTHLNPYRDAGGIRQEAEDVFDGRVIVADDSYSIEI